MYVALWVVFAVFVPSIRGECGFPGRPKFGSVWIGETEVKSSALTFETGTNATYRCDLPIETEQPDRICEPDGRWTGSIPSCLFNLALESTITSRDAARRNCSAQPLHDGRLDGCTIPGCLLSGAHLQFNFNGTFRVDSIAIIDNGSLLKADWTPRGINADQSATDLSLGLMSLRKVNGSTHVHLSVRDDRSWRSVQIDFYRVPQRYVMCEIEILGFSDDCGDPEVPSDGRVYRFGTSAIYQCDPGFRLEADSVARNCTTGVWTGEQPICMIHDTGPEGLKTTSLTLIWVLVGFTCGISLIVSAMAALFLVVKKRFVRQRKRSATLLQASFSKNQCFKMTDKCSEFPPKDVEENIYEELRFISEEPYVALKPQSAEPDPQISNNYEDPIVITKTNSDLEPRTLSALKSLN